MFLPTQSEKKVTANAAKSGWTAERVHTDDGRVVTYVRDGVELTIAFTARGRMEWACTADGRRLAPTAERVIEYMRNAPRRPLVAVT